jgi:uncharacterized membrane protein
MGNQPGFTDERRHGLSKTTRLGAAVLAGALAALIVGLVSAWQGALLFFWVAAAISWVVPVWITVLRLDAAETSRYATHEDPHGATADLLLLTASVAALGAVILGILKASGATGGERPLLLAAGIAAIVASWGVVHTVFTLRYAGLYYRGRDGGIDFNEDDPPVYADFAYVALTIGMTYQVSDTDLVTKAMRHTALRHALISYLLGTVIIAATINLAAGLVK